MSTVAVCDFGHPQQQRLLELSRALLAEAEAIARRNTVSVGHADSLAVAFQTLLVSPTLSGEKDGQRTAWTHGMTAVGVTIGYLLCLLPDDCRVAAIVDLVNNGLRAAEDSAKANADYMARAGHG